MLGSKGTAGCAASRNEVFVHGQPRLSEAGPVSCGAAGAALTLAQRISVGSTARPHIAISDHVLAMLDVNSLAGLQNIRLFELDDATATWASAALFLGANDSSYSRHFAVSDDALVV